MSMQAREGSVGLPLAWSRVRGDLLDVSVWVALAQTGHVHHGFAKRYWQETLAQFSRENVQAEYPDAVPRKLYFCRITMLGMVRVLSQTAFAYGQPISLNEAFSSYESFRLTDEVGFLHENLVNVDQALGAVLASQPNLPARISTDAYLAALAQSFGLRLVSLDRDFLRFHLPDCLIIPTDDIP
jgi:uncharacterized protein